MRVSIDKIFIDEGYQRDPARTEDRAKKYGKHFDERKAGIVLLSLRWDGQYACVDGWTRTRAARYAGKSTILSHVYRDLTQEEEAEVYLACNRDSKSPSALDTFKAELCQGDKAALEIKKTVEVYGLRIGTNSDSPDTINAITALKRVHKMGDDSLLQTLGTIIRLWDYDQHAFQGRMIEGLAIYMRRYSLTELRVKKLQKLHAETILLRADADTNSKSRSFIVADEIRKAAR